ncbi:Protein MAIN-LIKE 1 [Camellia lanceoleosa]|uniref:Protein MAIN-LIKE 1 n=1 Tax=Camellia lanceoleosa TaxID=1840588 RepID=A0ACC0HD43_9ERIC|nr:Protein MAIN-LIKE 1 [Camellia lanceoleosa]
MILYLPLRSMSPSVLNLLSYPSLCPLCLTLHTTTTQPPPVKKITVLRSTITNLQPKQHTTGLLNNLQGWTLDGRVLNKLTGSGFDYFRNLSPDLRLNLPLISAMISKYDVNDACFKFGGGGVADLQTLVFGLEDILYITGFPIDGKPVTGRDDSDPAQICQTYLGVSNILRVIKKGKEVTTSNVSLRWLREVFMTVPPHVEDNSPEFDCYVRAYVLYVIGSVIAPDPAGAQVSVMFLPLLENVNEIKNYAWGAAMLSYMHTSMAKLKDNLRPRKEIAGCFYALMIFAFLRISTLVSQFHIPAIGDEIAKFPLIVQRSNILRRITRDNWNHHRMNNFVEFFENLEGNAIIWKPYERMPVDFLPLPLRGQAIIGMSRTILICFEKAVYHRPDLSPRQFGLEGDFQSTLTDPLVEIRTISRSGPKVNRDWSKFGDYHRFNQEWERRHVLLINYQVDGANPSTAEIPQPTCLHPLPPTFVYNEGPNPSTSEIPQQAIPSEPPSSFVYNEGEESLFPMEWDSIHFSFESGNILGSFAGGGCLDDIATRSTTPNLTAPTVGDTQHNSPPPPTPYPTGASVGEGGLDDLGTGSTTPISTVGNIRQLPTPVFRSPNFLINESWKRRGARKRRVPARLGSTDYRGISRPFLIISPGGYNSDEA